MHREPGTIGVNSALWYKQPLMSRSKIEVVKQVRIFACM